MRNASLVEYEDFLLTEDFMEDYVGANGSIYQEINTLYNDGGIDNFEQLALTQLCEKAYDAHIGILSEAALKTFMENLKSDWENQNYAVNQEHGKLLPVVLAISLSSWDWWDSNHGAYPPSGCAIPVPVAADMAGAAIGGIVQAGKEIVNDDLSGGHSITGAGGRIGRSALTGAAVGSTGVVGKVAKFISRLFGKR